MLNTIKLLKSHKPLLLLYYLRNDRTCQFTSGVYEKQSHPKATELHSINTKTHLLSVHLWHIEFLLSQLWGYETQKQTWDKSWKWINKWRSCLWEQHQSDVWPNFHCHWFWSWMWQGAWVTFMKTTCDSRLK